MVTKIIPTDEKELEEWIGEGAYQKLGPEEFKEAVVAYAKSRMPDITRELIEQTTKAALKLAEESGYKPDAKRDQAVNRLPASEGVTRGNGHVSKGGVALSGAAAKIYDPDARGVALDGKFSRLAQYYKAVDYHRSPNDVDEALVKVLGEGQGDQGGFLVPEEFRATLLSLALETAIVRPRATVIPMSTPKIRIPTIRDTTHATTVFGGVQAYWTPESGSITASEPTFGQTVLDAKKLAGYTSSGNELIRDSAVSLEALLNFLFSNAISYFEDDAFINGVGAGQPVGILNADALVSVAKETGQTATTIVWENIVKMFSRMLPSSLGRGVWVANNDAIPQLYTMSLSVGTGGAPIFVQSGSASAPSTLLGRPIVFTEKAQTLGTAGDIYFVDFTYYLIGDRQSMEVASSEHVRFQNDETAWRIIQRVDGRPWLESALTPRSGSANTLSPFVSLATRA